MILKKRKTDDPDRTLISEDRLRRLMSDVISLREQVAQAELAARTYGRSSEVEEENESSA